MGGLVEKTEPAHSAGQALSVPLTFGCQYSETGLFRTQKVEMNNVVQRVLTVRERVGWWAR